MSGRRSQAVHERKAEFYGENFLRAAELMLEDYLSGKMQRCDAEPLIDEFILQTQEDNPNPERTGCPGTATLKLLPDSEVMFQAHLDHIKNCGPCIVEYDQILRGRLK